MEKEVETIAKFLEDRSREDDAERERFPSLRRLPKTDDTWIGWVTAAEWLYRQLKDTIKPKEKTDDK